MILGQKLTLNHHYLVDEGEEAKVRTKGWQLKKEIIY